MFAKSMTTGQLKRDNIVLDTWFPEPIENIRILGILKYTVFMYFISA